MWPFTKKKKKEEKVEKKVVETPKDENSAAKNVKTTSKQLKKHRHQKLKVKKKCLHQKAQQKQ